MFARRLVIHLTLIASAALAAACSPSQEPQAAAASDAAAPNLEDRARDLAMSSIIVDTHIDVPYRLEEEWADVSEATEDGDFDYPRAVAGGLNLAFMSIYTPAELEAEGKSFETAEKLIDLVERIVADAPEKFAIALSPADARQQFQQGLLSLPMGMENGSPVEGDLANVQHFYDRGIRYITLAHSAANRIADSSYGVERKWNGLSPFGREVIAEMADNIGKPLYPGIRYVGWTCAASGVSAQLVGNHGSAPFCTLMRPRGMRPLMKGFGLFSCCRGFALLVTQGALQLQNHLAQVGDALIELFNDQPQIVGFTVVGEGRGVVCFATHSQSSKRGLTRTQHG